MSDLQKEKHAADQGLAGSGAVDRFGAARNLVTPVWVYDFDAGRILFANEAACTLWQASSEAELVARDMTKNMSKTIATRLRQFQTDLAKSNKSFKEMWTFFPNGVPISACVSYRGFKLPDGRTAMLCEMLSDADDTPDNLRSTQALVHTDVMIALFEMAGEPLYMNPAARNVMNGPIQNLPSLFARQGDYHVMMFELDGRGEYRSVAKVCIGARDAWFDISAKICSDAVTGKPATLITAIDVTDLKIARDQARYLADRDQLTGCFNRAYMQSHFEGLIRYGSLNYALLYFDIDRFKQINDTFGHDVGDEVLVEMAKRAFALVSANDIVVRLGGDEFAVLLSERDGERLRMRIDDIFKVLSSPMVSGSASLQTFVSMGISEFTSQDIDFETVLRQADIALYHSKRNGRNRMTYYSAEMGHAAAELQKLEDEIQTALKQREFTLFYQPRIDLITEKIVSMEGLVRWNHPTRGLVSPGVFVPICEENGMIEHLGQLVLDMGFKQARTWHAAGLDIGVSLNVSPRQFSDDALMDMLEAQAKDPGFAPDKIELEITENVLIGDMDTISAKLEAISEMGYKIAIDDFGTGYSNLSYISQFNLSCLKIDQSFIAQLPQSGPVISLIIALGKQIGATVVAEGVETKMQYDWLKRHACHQIQGYYISKPKPVSHWDAL